MVFLTHYVLRIICCVLCGSALNLIDPLDVLTQKEIAEKELP